MTTRNWAPQMMRSISDAGCAGVPASGEEEWGNIWFMETR